MTETRFSRIARSVVGGLLVLESLGMLAVAFFGAIIGGLSGALAFVAGAGNATNTQIARGFALIGASLAAPFLVAAVLAMGGLLLLLRKKRNLIITAGVVVIAAQVAFQVFLAEGFHVATLGLGLVHALAIAVGLAFVPVTPPRQVAPAR
jgi:hypothetical protein